ncbi:hypothetical protein [Pelagibacterium halotolerans]|uniref:hypothetical protein n=1 Tax=Pelagibacterium halotolerans TaxID=531813 RepID=UPI00384A58C2
MKKIRFSWPWGMLTVILLSAVATSSLALANVIADRVNIAAAQEARLADTSMFTVLWQAPVYILFSVGAGLTLALVMGWPAADAALRRYREYRMLARKGAEDRALIALADIPTIRWSPADFRACYSSAWWKLLGLEQGRDCDIDVLISRLAGSDVAAARAGYEALAEGGPFAPARLVFMRHADGRTIPVEERAQRFEDGRVLIVHRPLESPRSLVT